MSVEAYKNAIKACLPNGLAWVAIKRNPFIKALAYEFSRIEARAADLLVETNPTTTVELLPDFEEMYGLPDECTPEDLDYTQRINQLTQRVAKRGGISVEYYTQLALQLGFEVTVTKAKEFKVGSSVVGDYLTNFDSYAFVVGMSVGQELYHYGWRYYITIDLPATASTFFTVGKSRVGEPLVKFENQLLECIFYKFKPAEAGLFFRYV